MRKKISTLTLAFVTLLTFSSLAQNLTLKGIILDGITLQPLSFTTIIFDKTQTAITDSNGIFILKMDPGKHTLKVSRVGYQNYENPYEELLTGNREIQILLEPFVNQLGQVVIAGSRSAKQVAREITSVNIIQPYLISNTNATDLAEVLNKVPGVNVIDGQPTIRGGVGFSFNTGSRVAILLDDMPLLGADLGDVRWNFLPIESAEQIEVIKGSASVLYGSSALNGTVNVRTGWGNSKPQTKIQFYEGVSSNPKRKETIWWTPTHHPFNAGAFFSHKQSWGKFDLVWCGNTNLVSSHIQKADTYRGRTYIKTRYRVNKNLSYGINLNLMYEQAGRYFLWQNADSGALKPLDNYVVDDFYRIFSFDPHVDWVKGKSTHAFKTRIYQIRRYVDPVLFPKDNDAIANLYAFDYNFKRNLGKRFFITAGNYSTTLWSVGNVYKGEFTGFSTAVYSQLEYRYKRWNAVIGGRYEINGLAQLVEPTGLLKRIGGNYEITSKTFIRANYSEGYRFPTIGEKYVEDRAAGLNIFPNPTLVSEKGWTAEIGLQQGFKIGNFVGAIDFAVFNQQYDSMIEFRFGQWVSALEDPPSGKFGFKSVNIGKTRIAGYEISLTGEGRIGDVLIRTIGGFTYSMPVNLSTNPELRDWNNYSEAFFGSMGKLDSSKYYKALLPYRNRKTGKWDIEGTYRKFSLGYTFNYYSTYEKVDEFIPVFIPSIKDFFARAGDGDFVQNARTSLQINQQTRISFIVNNFTNREYATRPGKVDPPRSFNIQLRVMF
ncbi:MAG: TonB-dependent receptor [Bacteroidia bacterium]|nr:TonB-dependent receptor [Bacteroidia bacterium]